MKIKNIIANEVLDSRGKPTVRVLVELTNGASGQALVPSGASVGSYEAKELRDKEQRFNGQGVLKALENIEKIIFPALKGRVAKQQEKIDKIMLELDGTKNKSKLGANAILAVSLAVAKAAAASEKLPLYKYLSRFNPLFSGKYILPYPLFNILNGGRHADWASDIQEYMIAPLGAKTMAQAVQMGAEIYHTLKVLLKEKGFSILVGDEGGFAPATKNNFEPFKLLESATVKAGYKLGKEVFFAIDAAAQEFYQHPFYHLKKENKVLNTQELAQFYQKICQNYPLYSLEDIFSEDDFSAFASFLQNNPHLQIVGDDLYVTNKKRLEQGIAKKASNAILIKLNQVGTLWETIEVINLAIKHNLKTIISHRSGETEDTFIADLAVAMGTGQIKAGAPARAERTAKYNRLLVIEKELAGNSSFSDLLFTKK